MEEDITTNLKLNKCSFSDRHPSPLRLEDIPRRNSSPRALAQLRKHRGTALDCESYEPETPRVLTSPHALSTPTTPHSRSTSSPRCLTQRTTTSDDPISERMWGMSKSHGSKTARTPKSEDTSKTKSTPRSSGGSSPRSLLRRNTVTGIPKVVMMSPDKRQKRKSEPRSRKESSQTFISIPSPIRKGVVTKKKFPINKLPVVDFLPTCAEMDLTEPSPPLIKRVLSPRGSVVPRLQYCGTYSEDYLQKVSPRNIV